jgi:hypothetical protein
MASKQLTVVNGLKNANNDMLNHLYIILFQQ